MGGWQDISPCRLPLFVHSCTREVRRLSCLQRLLDAARDDRKLFSSNSRNSLTESGSPWAKKGDIVRVSPFVRVRFFGPIDAAATPPLTGRTGLPLAFHRLTTRTLRRA